jgi:multidrug efflux system membrane fusion protein
VRADADTPLITINKVTPVFVSFALPDRYLDTLREGLTRSPLSLSVFSPGGGLELASGLVRQLDNSVDLNTGTIHLRAELANHDHRLWPGEFVDAVLNLATQRQTISVPKAAIQGGEHGPYVFLVTKDATADLRLVKVGVEVGERVEILEGIKPGDEVVTDGQLRLRPAAKVRIESQAGVATEQAQ